MDLLYLIYRALCPSYLSSKFLNKTIWNLSFCFVVLIKNLYIKLGLFFVSRRGLSQFYHGKSESFTSLAKVVSIEDLPKKLKNPYTRMRKMKTNNKSYGGGLDNYKLHTLRKSTISKKLSPFLRQRSFARSWSAKQLMVFEILKTQEPSLVITNSQQFLGVLVSLLFSMRFRKFW